MVRCQTREHILLARQVGVPAIASGSKVSLTWWMTMVSICGDTGGSRSFSKYDFPGDDIPIVRVFGLLRALEGDGGLTARTS